MFPEVERFESENEVIVKSSTRIVLARPIIKTNNTNIVRVNPNSFVTDHQFFCHFIPNFVFQ